MCIDCRVEPRGDSLCCRYDSLKPDAGPQCEKQYGQGYPGPDCFKSITVEVNGKQEQATIMDEVCFPCLSSESYVTGLTIYHTCSAWDARGAHSTFPQDCSRSSPHRPRANCTVLGGLTTTHLLLLHHPLLRLHHQRRLPQRSSHHLRAAALVKLPRIRHPVLIAARSLLRLSRPPRLLAIIAAAFRAPLSPSPL